MRKGGSRMRRLDRADGVAVLDGGRPLPLANDRRGHLLETCARTFRRFAALGLVVLVRCRGRYSPMLVGGRDVGMLWARGRCLALRPFMHRCDRRCVLHRHLHGGGCIARSIQDQADAQQQTQQDGGQRHAITITNGPLDPAGPDLAVGFAPLIATVTGSIQVSAPGRRRHRTRPERSHGCSRTDRRGAPARGRPRSQA